MPDGRCHVHELDHPHTARIHYSDGRSLGAAMNTVARNACAIYIDDWCGKHGLPYGYVVALKQFNVRGLWHYPRIPTVPMPVDSTRYHIGPRALPVLFCAVNVRVVTDRPSQARGMIAKGHNAGSNCCEAFRLIAMLCVEVGKLSTHLISSWCRQELHATGGSLRVTRVGNLEWQSYYSNAV
eukprot:jgi/Mesvir1/5883/Mv25167-RA.1